MKHKSETFVLFPPFLSTFTIMSMNELKRWLSLKNWKSSTTNVYKKEAS